jgi:thiol-disulfide isomerase/thioredoxin
MTFFTRRRKILILEIVLIIAVYLVARGYSQRHLVSGTSPAIEATTLGGDQIRLSDFRDKPVLIHFWASWCPVCELEQESIQSISNDYPVVSIAMQSGSELEVSAHLQENKLSFPTIVDEDGKLARQFGVRGVPTSFIITTDKKIKFKEVGYTTETGLRVRLWLAGN